MTPTITAIETRWDGYRFRSRTEARWAVALAHVGIKYVYEHEGFRLSDGTPYLPDFYLPALNAVLEVKGSPDADICKPLSLARSSDMRVFVAFGAPAHGSSIHYLLREGSIKAAHFAQCPACGNITIAHAEEDPHTWTLCSCLSGGMCGIIDNLMPPFVRGFIRKHEELLRNPLIDHLLGCYLHPNQAVRIYDAIEKARSARFEHGESPEVPHA